LYLLSGSSGVYGIDGRGGEKVKALATVNDCKGWSFFRYRKIREIGNKPLSAFFSETLRQTIRHSLVF
jgi:hypothetical protein